MGRSAGRHGPAWAAAGMLAAGVLGLHLAKAHGGLPLVWPAMGVAVWILLSGGYRAVPWVLAADLAIGVGLSDARAPEAAALALANTCAALAGARLWRAAGGRDDGSGRNARATWVAAVAAPTISSLAGAILFPADDWAGVLRLAGNIWMSDALGILMVLPALRAAPELGRRLRAREASDAGKALGLLAAAAATSWLIGQTIGGHGFVFVVFPLVMLAYAWFGATAAGVLGWLVVVGVLGFGPTHDARSGEIAHVRLWLAGLGLVGLVLPMWPARRIHVWPIGVLLLGSACSGWAYTMMERNARATEEKLFRERVAVASLGIVNRVVRAADVLLGGVAVMADPEKSGRDAWRAYEEKLALPTRMPWVQAIGVILPVAADRTEAWRVRRAAEGIPDAEIVPFPGSHGTTQAEKFAITYVEPWASNRASFGSDIATDPSRRAAAIKSRDDGTPTLVRRIPGQKDTLRPAGMLMYAPIYRKGAPVSTIEERRAAHLGWVYAQIRPERFFTGLIYGSPHADGEVVQFHWFETGDLSRASELYVSPGAAAKRMAAADPRAKPKFEWVTEQRLTNQPYFFGWDRGPDYPPDLREPVAAVAGGLGLVTLLLAGLVLSLQTSGARAEEMTIRRTRELREARRRLEGVLDGAMHAIVATDAAGAIEVFNGGAERMLGYKAAEVLGRKAAEVLRSAEERAGPVGLEKGARTEPHEEREGTWIRRDGSTLAVAVSVMALRAEENGEPTGFLWVAQDIAERRRLEDDVRSERELLRTVIDVLPLAVYLKDRESRFLMLNREVARWLGCADPAQLIGRSDTEFFGAETAAKFRKDEETAMRGERVEQTEETARYPTGETLTVLTTKVAVRDRDGRVIGVLGAGLDITARKSAEARVAVQEERLRLSTEAAGAGVWEWEVGSDRVNWDAQMFAIYRVAPAPDGVVPYSAWADALLPEELPGQIALLERIVREQGRSRHEFRIRPAGCDEVRVIQAAAVVVPGSGGRPTRIVGVNIDITERRRAEEEMRAGRERLAAIFSAVEDGIALRDHEGRIVECNAAVERILGLTRAELIGRSPSALLLAGEGDQPFEAPAEQHPALVALRTGKSVSGLVGHRRNGHELVWIMIRAVPIRDAEGRVAMVVSSFSDVTESRRAARALAEQEARLRRVIEAMPVGVRWTRRNGDRLESVVNPAHEEITGISGADTLRPGSYFERTHPDDKEAQAANLARLDAGELRHFSMEKRYLRPDGGVRWVSVSWTRLSAPGAADFEKLSTVTDITGRKDAEAALRASESRFRNAFDYAGVGMGLLTPDWRWQQANQALLTMLGSSAGELQATTLPELLHPDEAEADGPRFAELLAGGIPYLQVERRLRHRLGHYPWGRVTLTVIRAPDGQPLQAVAQIEDISERRRLMEGLAQARDAALEASRLKSEFLAMMSHEIRTPMNAVIGMANLLGDTPLNSEQTEMVRTMTVGAETLLTIINDVLDISRIEAGKMRLDAADFDFRRTVEEVVGLLAARAHEKRLELTCEFESSPAGPVLGDGGRVRQVLTNLVGNAIKFTDTGEVAVKVRVLSDRAGRIRLRAEVRDTGVGIPAAAGEKLFRPFAQVETGSTRRFDGTGLGLAISRQLVALMGGDIGFESEVGRGSTFWVELEFAHRIAPEPEPTATLPPGRRILVVDDNETNRRIMVGQLEPWGVEVVAVAEAAAALRVLRDATAGPWHLVLLDWHMPGTSGLELAVEIRADPELATLPLVMLSSAGQHFDVGAATAVGFAAFLIKPVAAHQLRRCLARVLAESVDRETRAESPATASPSGRETGRGLRLLLAEDNPANQRVAKMLLARMGHDVRVAGNGEEALSLLGEGRFDAVLMDCQMPRLDGYGATRRIRSGELPGLPKNIPIIALTAYARPEDRARCIEAGMDDYVTKPIRSPELRAALERCGLGGPAVDVPAGSAMPATDDPVFDYDALRSARELPGIHGPSLFAELVEMYLGEEPERLVRLEQLLEQQAAESLGDEAHSLGGNAATFGGKEVRRVALDLERAARARDWAAAAERFASLVEACARLRAGVVKFMPPPAQVLLGSG